MYFLLILQELPPNSFQKKAQYWGNKFEHYCIEGNSQKEEKRRGEEEEEEGVKEVRTRVCLCVLIL
jgi:hypothetical protein